jgi:hypothetical protein
MSSKPSDPFLASLGLFPRIWLGCSFSLQRVQWSSVFAFFSLFGSRKRIVEAPKGINRVGRCIVVDGLRFDDVLSLILLYYRTLPWIMEPEHVAWATHHESLDRWLQSSDEVG